MAHIYKSRVADTSVTTGLGSIGLTGLPPQVNVRIPADVMQPGDTAYFCIVNRGVNEWEEGIYTYVGVNLLSRTRILDSSNSGSIVDFSAGVKDVFLTAPSLLDREADENITAAGSAIIDFGAWPGSPETSISITGQFSISSNSFLSANLLAQDTDDHSADEVWVDPPTITAGNVVAGSGFTIYAQAHTGNLYGKYPVNWIWK